MGQLKPLLQRLLHHHLANLFLLWCLSLQFGCLTTWASLCRFVLSLRSPDFKAMLEGGLAEAKSSVRATSSAEICWMVTGSFYS